jgi:hypothetical protein
VARRRAEAMLDEPIESVPTEYARKPLLRNEGRRIEDAADDRPVP